MPKGTCSIYEPLVLFSHMFYVLNSISTPKRNLTCDVIRNVHVVGLPLEQNRIKLNRWVSVCYLISFSSSILPAASMGPIYIFPFAFSPLQRLFFSLTNHYFTPPFKYLSLHYSKRAFWPSPSPFALLSHVTEVLTSIVKMTNSISIFW